MGKCGLRKSVLKYWLRDGLGAIIELSLGLRICDLVLGLSAEVLLVHSWLTGGVGVLLGGEVVGTLRGGYCKRGSHLLLDWLGLGGRVEEA
jgi:hypothetical protein